MSEGAGSPVGRSTGKRAFTTAPSVPFTRTGPLHVAPSSHVLSTMRRSGPPSYGLYATHKTPLASHAIAGVRAPAVWSLGGTYVFTCTGAPNVAPESLLIATKSFS